MTTLIASASTAAFIAAFAAATVAAHATRGLRSDETAIVDKAMTRFIVALFLTILFSALGGAGAMWCLS